MQLGAGRNTLGNKIGSAVLPLIGQLDRLGVYAHWVVIRNIGRIDRKRIIHVCVPRLVITLHLPVTRNVDFSALYVNYTLVIVMFIIFKIPYAV